MSIWISVSILINCQSEDDSISPPLCWAFLCLGTQEAFLEISIQGKVWLGAVRLVCVVIWELLLYLLQYLLLQYLLQYSKQMSPSQTFSDCKNSNLDLLCALDRVGEGGGRDLFLCLDLTLLALLSASISVQLPFFQLLVEPSPCLAEYQSGISSLSRERLILSCGVRLTRTWDFSCTLCNEVMRWTTSRRREI